MQNLEKEVWKTVEEHPNYYVSNLGRVFSVKLNRILEGYIDKTRNYKFSAGKPTISIVG